VRFAILAAIAAIVPVTVLAAGPDFDIKQPASPPRPQPEWLKIIDQGKFDPRLKGYMTPDGFRVEIVAEEPTIVNPVGMTFGTDGTLYVLEWRPSPGDEWRETPVTFTYKDGSTRNVATMKKKQKDILKILKWNDSKKVYDQSEIILEDELPSSILLYDGWIYLTGRGSVRRYRQSVPGGSYDIKQVIAQGFCGFHHHQVSGLTLGIDGWLYITAGDDDNYVEGSDGTRSTVLRTGAIFRCRPDGSMMHAYSMGYRNPYRDVAFDTVFNIFHVDNDNEDGSKFTGCRLMHVPEESDFGWRLFTGARCCRPDSVRGAVFGELPGKLPPMLKTGRGSPAGLLIYNDTFFPEPHRGWLIYPDVFRKLVRAYKVEPDGSTFRVAEEFELLKSNDPLFRPCQMVLGPDGAMYVCDWRTDSGGAGRLWGDGVHGRIYRISWAGDGEHPAIPLRGMDSWDKIVKQSDAGLLNSLSSPNFSDRLVGQRELVRRGERNRWSLLGILANPQAAFDARILALGAAEVFWNHQVRAAMIATLRDTNQDLVRLAANALSDHCDLGDVEASEALVGVLDSASPPTRRAVCLALGRLGAPGVEDYLINVFRSETGDDVYLRDGIVRSIERLGARGIQKFVELSESGDLRQLDRVVDAFQTLRTRPAVEALPHLLLNPHLKPGQRVALLQSFRNYLFDPPLGPDLLIRCLESQVDQPSQVKIAGLEMLGIFGRVPSEKVAPLLLRWLDDNDPEMRRTAIRAVGETRIGEAVPVLIKRLNDDSRSLFERTEIIKALRSFNDPSTVAPLLSLAKNDSLNSIDGQTMRIEALRSLLTLDPNAARDIATTWLDKNIELQSEAVATLGTAPEGAKKVGELFVAGKLPRELLPRVSEALRKHLAKEAGLGKLLTEVMRGGLLVSLDKSQIENVRTLVKSKGNSKKGRELFLNAKTLACIRCHRLEGIGGNIGPDLTRVWETQSLEKVMESMIDPSKEIKEGYQAYRVLTTTGLTFTGLKVSDTKSEVVLKEATGNEVHIRKSDVEELEASKQSLMPDNVISQLTFDQFIDLVAFLRDRSAQESLRGLARDFWVIGPYAQELKAPAPPEKSSDPKAELEGMKPDVKLKWQAREAEPNGYLDLRAVFGREHISAYALTYVYSPKVQKVDLLTGSDDQLRVWINGKLVHEFAQNRDAKPDADRVAVELKTGWNTVLAKVTNSVATHGLYLRFAGGDGIRMSLQKD
jgi:putative membrane-bound dehydrogenase-like protein